MERVTQELQQPSLLAARARGRARRVDPELIGRLVTHLHGRGWVRRRHLVASMGISDDVLRAVARHSKGEVIGSSARGYALTREASVADVGAVIGEMLSRSKQLQARAAEVLQVMNGRPRRAEALPAGIHERRGDARWL